MENALPLVDTHAHVFNRRMPLSATAWNRPTYEFTAERLVETLDAHRIPFGVIGAASLFDDYSDYTLEALDKYKRLRATVIVAPDISRETLAGMQARGVRGIRFVWNRTRDLPDLHSPAYSRLLTRVADLGLHVQIYLDAARLPPVLDRLNEFDLDIAIDHFGDPNTDEGLRCPGFQAVLRSVQKGRTWVRLSSPYRMKDPGAAPIYVAALLAEAGTGRLMWGSDAPFVAYETRITYEEELRQFLRWIPSAPLRTEISHTALRFYFF